MYGKKTRSFLNPISECHGKKKSPKSHTTKLWAPHLQKRHGIWLISWWHNLTLRPNAHPNLGSPHPLPEASVPFTSVQKLLQWHGHGVNHASFLTQSFIINQSIWFRNKRDEVIMLNRMWRSNLFIHVGNFPFPKELQHPPASWGPCSLTTPSWKRDSSPYEAIQKGK